MSFLEIYLWGFVAIMALLTILWIWSVVIKNASIIDPFWGFGFVVLVWFYLYNTEVNPRSLFVVSLVTIWGLRLSIFLFIRNMGHGEDFRYQKFREDYGPERYWWVSFFQVFLLQGVLMLIVSAPLLGTLLNAGDGSLGVIDYVIASIWLIGLMFEAGGDYQLTKFKKNPANKGKVLNTGFWKYTRHPNYFGDSVIWWSFGLFALTSGSYYTIIGPILMNLLLLKVSGVALLERTLKKSKPEYEEYVRKTNSFFPWFPKN